MARIDDFIGARDQAVDALVRQTPAAVAQRAGFELNPDNSLRIPFLTRTYHVSFPEFQFADAIAGPDQPDVPLQEQVLLLHYLLAEGPAAGADWISYRDIPGAAFYYSVFVKRATDPLKKVFAADLPAFERAAARLGGQPSDLGDRACTFQVLPRLALQTIIWQGDEDFAPEANILFSDNARTLLLPEDAAWLAGMLVYRMMALAH